MNDTLENDEETTTDEIKPFIVAIEETHHLADEVKPLTGRFWTLYVYNAAEATHCCEITPSYWLEPYDQVSEKRMSDDLRSDLRSYMYDDACYMHCSIIDRMVETGFAEALTTYDANVKWDSMEEVQEYLQGNETIPRGLDAILPPYDDEEEEGG